MAVQAQYPSNVLLLNRNVQEGKNVLTNDYSLQPQPVGFLDPSHMLFNNGGVNGNTRKRGREIANSMATATAMNQFLMPESQPLQLIDLSQLHNNQTSNVVSTGLRLSFADQLHQQHHQNLMPHSSSSSSPSPSFFFSEGLASQIKQQRDEIDQFLQAQCEQLRRTIAEKRQRHYRALLSVAEETVARKLREKEAEVEKAARRNAELEARAAQLSVEVQVWQAKARAQEATAASLQAQLQQAIISGCCAPAQDQEGGVLGLRCAASAGGENPAEDAESAYIDPERVEPIGPVCKVCRRRAASVVLLPCRHLCLCKECDAVAQACPLCLSHRKSSVEVFLS